MNFDHFTLPSCRGGALEDADEPSASFNADCFPLSHRSTSHSLRGGDGSDIGSSPARARITTPNHSVSAAAQSLWVPSQLTSPYRVLRAASMRDDYYTSSLSWGQAYVALTLRDELLLFHSHYPRERFAVFRFGRPPYALSSSPSASGPTSSFSPTGGAVRVTQTDDASSAVHNLTKRPTSVVVSRYCDSTCFVGFDDGTADLFLARGDSQHMVCSQSFGMPTPPTAGLLQILSTSRQSTAAGVNLSRNHSRGNGSPENAILRRTEQALEQLAPSLASVSTMDTTQVYPWLAAVGTSASGVITLDARLPQPCHQFRQVSFSSSSFPTTGATAPTPPMTATAALQHVSTFLEQQERVCAVRWNASGSLLAVGDDRGTVRVWSLTQPKAPLHTIVLAQGSTMRALAFHPTNPSELLVGCGTAGPDGLRLYDLSSASPRWTWSGHTAGPITQALYSPDGAYIVTANGDVSHAADLSRHHPITAEATASGHHTVRRASGSDVVLTAAYADRGRAVAASPTLLSTPTPWCGMRSTLESAAAAAVAGDGGRNGGDDLPHQRTSIGDVGAGEGSVHRALTSPVLSPTHASAPAQKWAVSHALTVWKRGAPRGSQDVLREAVLDKTPCAPARWEDLLQPTPSHNSGRSARDRTSLSPVDSLGYGSPLDAQLSAERHYGDYHTGNGGGVCTLMPQYTLGGHTSRPLHMAAPYHSSPDSGHVASVAAGEDGTLRLWCVFKHVAAASTTSGSTRSGRSTAREPVDDASNPDLYTGTPLR